MPKIAQKGGPDLLALAMRRARDDVAAGQVPKRPSEPADRDEESLEPRSGSR